MNNTEKLDSIRHTLRRDWPASRCRLIRDLSSLVDGLRRVGDHGGAAVVGTLTGVEGPRSAPHRRRSGHFAHPGAMSPA